MPGRESICKLPLCGPVVVLRISPSCSRKVCRWRFGQHPPPSSHHPSDGGGGKRESYTEPSIRHAKPVQNPEIQLSWTAVRPALKSVARGLSPNQPGFSAPRQLSCSTQEHRRNPRMPSQIRYRFSASLMRSSLNLGWAMLIMASALSRVDIPLRLTIPYSVTR